VISEGIGVARAVVETKAEVEFGMLKIGVGDKKGDVLGAKVEGKEEIIEHLKKELEQKDQVIAKKDERIKELEQQQTSQQAKQQENQNFLVTKAFDAMVEVAAKSANNSRAPSPTPPAYSKE